MTKLGAYAHHVVILVLVLCCLQVRPSYGWGWLLIGNWSTEGFTLPCTYQTCIQVPNEDTAAQLASYRCRGEVWWQEQFTYNKTTRQITTQPRYGPLVCVDIIPSSAKVGVAACNATSKSQQWSFVGTKIQNAATSLFMQIQPPSGYYLTAFSGASLSVTVGPQQSGYISDFTLMDSTVLQNYTPPLPPPSTPNHVQNGLFGMNWREPDGLEAGDMTEICNWKIMADIDLNQDGNEDTYGWNVQLNAGPQHVNRHGQMGSISQLVATHPGREHTLVFQGSGLGSCGGKTKNVTVSIVPSSVNSTTVPVSAGVGWQTVAVAFNATGKLVNLTFTSASDEGSLCGANITDVKLGLKGAFDAELGRGGKRSTEARSSGRLSGLEASLVAAVVVMGVILLGVLVVLRSRIRRLAQRTWSADSAVNVISPTCTRFRFWQLKAYTNNFRDKIGEGGFSVVYLGTTADGTQLAVKRMKRPDDNFPEEVELLSRVHHRRVVKFLGYCDEGKEQILVSEYMENGSLYDALHKRPEGGHILTFEQRLKIARDVAFGLEYLHHGASPGIIHRDIKSANVLLDRNLSAKVADFGSFKQGHDNTFSINSSLQTINYRGTFGYMDPTFATNLTVSTKSDVYSFGVLLLELVTGRKAMDVHGMAGFDAQMGTRASDVNIMDHPPSLEIVDPLLEEFGAEAAVTLQLMVSTAYQCMHPVREDRPSMIEVVRLLGPGEAYEDTTPAVVSVSPSCTPFSSHNTTLSLVPLVDSSVQASIFTQGR